LGTSYFTTRELESTTQGPGNARPVYEEHIITKGYSVVFQPGNFVLHEHGWGKKIGLRG
jgi:hypothetical protein